MKKEEPSYLDLKLRRNEPKSIIEFRDIGSFLSEGQYSYKDFGINDKIFTYWKANGLLDFLGKGKWSRLSQAQLVWVKFLETLRLLGCSLNLMKSLYQELYKKAYDDQLATLNLETQIQRLTELSRKRCLNEEEQEILNEISAILKNPVLLHALNTSCSYFNEYLIHIIRDHAQVELLIFPDEGCCFYVMYPEDESEHDLAFVQDRNRPHKKINLNFLISELVTDQLRTELQRDENSLTGKERTILQALRIKDLSRLIVNFKSEKSEIDSLELECKGLITGEKAKRVMEVLNLKNYSGIDISTRDKKILSYVHRKKLNL